MRKRAILCLLALPFLVFAEEEFASVMMDVPVYLNGDEIGTSNVELFVGSGDFKIDPKDVEKQAGKLLSVEGLETLERLITASYMLGDKKEISSEKFHIWFEPKNQSIHVDVAPELLKIQTADVKKDSVHKHKKGATKDIPRSFASGYVNVFAGEKLNKTYFPNYKTSHHQTFGNVDAVFNLHDWVLQGFAYYVGKTSQGLNRGNVLLTHDFPDKKVRLSFGDINTMGVGYQNTIPITGVSLGKNYRLFTDSTVGPMSRYELFLNVPSKVEVYLDGMLIKIMELKAGPHSLQEFPLVDGMNNVQLKIYSPTGEVRTVDLNYFYSGEVLARGTSEYNVSLGWPSFNEKKREDGFNQYGQFPVFSMTYTIGVASNTSLASYMQATYNDFFTGWELVNLNRYFRSVWDFGISYIMGEQTDIRTRWGLFSTNKKGSIWNWKLALEYIGKEFGVLGQIQTRQHKRFTASGATSFRLNSAMSLGFVGEFALARKGKAPYYGQVDFSTYLGKYITLKTIGKYERFNSGHDSWTGAFSFDFVPRLKDLALRVNYNSRQKMLIADATYNKKLSNNRSFSASAGYNEAPDARTGTGSLIYEGVRGVLGGSNYLAKLSATNSNSTVNVTNFNIGTAFVFADNVYTIGKPIQDSFVIVAPNKYLKHAPLLVNPNYAGEYQARATYWLPAVLPLRAYRDAVVNISAEQELVTAALEGTSYQLRPSYKSGSVISLGEPPTYIVEGRFLTREGKLIEEVGGLLINDEDGKVYSFFTDFRGKFQMVGILPGTYTVKMALPGSEPFKVVIGAEDQEATYIDLKEVAVPVKEAKKKKSGYYIAETEEGSK